MDKNNVSLELLERQLRSAMDEAHKVALEKGMDSPEFHAAMEKPDSLQIKLMRMRPRPSGTTAPSSLTP